jgi:hypothetical protein
MGIVCAILYHLHTTQTLHTSYVLLLVPTAIPPSTCHHTSLSLALLPSSFRLISMKLINFHCIMFYHIRIRHIITNHIKSYQIISHHIKSYQIISKIISNHIKSYQMSGFYSGPRGAVPRIRWIHTAGCFHTTQRRPCNTHEHALTD